MEKTTQKINGKNVIKLAFSSLTDFFNVSENGKSTLSDDNRASRKNGDTSFFHSKSWADAVSMQKNGWPEGIRKSKKLQNKLVDMVKGKLVMQEARYQVECDGDIDVSKYLSGVPECNVVVDEHETSLAYNNGQIITLYLELCCNAGISSENYILRGPALLTFVKMLEYTGRSVKIVLTLCSESFKGNKRLEIHINAKQHGQFVNDDVLAYALMSPAFFRRHGFSIKEQMEPEELKSFDINLHGGYGRAGNKSIFIEDRPDVVSTSIKNIDISTIEGAERWLIEQLKANGIEIKD